MAAFVAAVDDTATNIRSIGDQQMADQVGAPTFGVVRAVHVTPSVLVITAVVLAVDETAANKYKIGDHATATYVSVGMVVAAVHATFGGPTANMARFVPPDATATHISSSRAKHTPFTVLMLAGVVTPV